MDSAGISDWHAGKSPDPRGQKAISKKGMKTSHIGRQVSYKCYLPTVKRKYLLSFHSIDYFLENLEESRSKIFLSKYGRLEHMANS